MYFAEDNALYTSDLIFSCQDSEFLFYILFIFV